MRAAVRINLASPITKKACTKCGEVKSLREFYRRTASRDGYGYRCARCQNKATKSWMERTAWRTKDYAKIRIARLVPTTRPLTSIRINLAPPITRKACTKCGEVKLLVEFKACRPSTPTLRRSKCQSCGRAESREWHRRHPGYVARWQRKNRDRGREYIRRRLASGEGTVLRERINAQMRVWAKANRVRVRVHEHNARARRANAPGFSTPDQVLARAAFYGNCCAYCRGPYEVMDHVVPLARGGSNWPANLRPACKICNDSKKAKRLSEWNIKS